ncbi:hypothetical protein ACHAWF_014304 [Thalassiosira exigua]
MGLYTLYKQSSECAAAASAEEELTNVTESIHTDDFYFDDMGLPKADEPDDCEPQIEYPFCHSLYFSIFRTFTMMLGEFDSTSFHWNAFSLILFCIFAFAEVLTLLNILIAIITDLYGVITNDRAEIALVKKDKVEVSWERILWKKLIECFDPEMGSNGMGMILVVPLRIFICMVLIPLWLLLGIMSAGWLWPPQVREGLFVQEVSQPDGPDEGHEMEQRMEEVTALREDLSNVQEHLIEQFIEGRKDVTALKERVKEVKLELKEEMKNIKKVMTSLFEVQQQALIS